jgi:PadR family transcriptional regulator, regulatory protein PadR
MAVNTCKLLPGTLDLMVLGILAGNNSLHGFGIAREIEKISEQSILINQGTIYASLVRLQKGKLITGAWGHSVNNRKAIFYSVTGKGEKQLGSRMKDWDLISSTIGRIFQATRYTPNGT